MSELQIFTKGNAVDRGLIRPGHYGISENDEKVTDLGESINLVALARRPKAIDMTDANAVVTNYDPETEEFKQIAARSLEINSHCVYGPSFLVYEQGTKRFLEFFCGTKATRSKAKEIYPFLPMTASGIARQMAAGNDVSGLEPHGPLPLMLKTQLVKKGKYTWHVPVVTKCHTTFTMPTEEQINTEVSAFIPHYTYTILNEPVKKQGGAKGIDVKTNWVRWPTLHYVLASMVFCLRHLAGGSQGQQGDQPDGQQHGEAAARLFWFIAGRCHIGREEIRPESRIGQELFFALVVRHSRPFGW